MSILGRYSTRTIRLLVCAIVLLVVFFFFATRPAHVPTSLDDFHSDTSSAKDNRLEDVQYDNEITQHNVEEHSSHQIQNSESAGFTKEVQNVLSGLEEHRLQLVNFTPEDYALMEKRMGMSSGALPQTKDAYYARLKDLVTRWFAGRHMEGEMEDMIKRFELRDIRLGSLKQKVTSTDKNGPEGTPEGFEIWSEIATSQDGWTVDVLDDERMEKMITEWTLGDKGKVKRIWDKLNFPVLKADLLRYYVLLLEGGIYTDSDTVPRAHPYDWGARATDQTDPMISMLDSNLAFMRHLHAHMNAGDKSQHTKGDGKMGITNPDVSIIISLEDNRWKEDDMSEWHGGTEIPDRRLSMCQWTMMAKNGHPIYLDAIGTVLDNLDAAVKEGHLDGSIRATELTGPPNFTDAVFRYLLVQYGVTPHDLVGLRRRNAYRIGDVIVYGPGSFGPMYKRRGDHVVGDVAMPVGHMYKGRWKDKGWD